MELRHLRYFDAVATERNFTRAAERLGVAQPPLSRQIRELEDVLEVALFDRSTRPVTLTEAGKLFHDQCVRILASVEQLGQSVRHLHSASRRLFIIGMVGSILQGAMPAIIRRFRALMPDIEVELVELTTVEQIAALKEGRIDAGLGRVRVDDINIRREILYEEPLMVAFPAAHALADSQDQVSLRELLADTLILYPSQPRPSYADQVLGLFRDTGAAPQRIREVREVQTALGLVAAQAGIAIIPISMRHVQRGDIVYRTLSDDRAVSPIILSQRSGDETPLAEAFRQICHELFDASTAQTSVA
ncbi:LysR family transcriptional regulator [soil metagenome]